jgi:response regulator RpfG family c-di-GMP phosphodiesterase
MKSPIEKRIRQKLQERNLTVTELANQIGVSRVALYYLFKGNFSREMLSKISQVLTIPPHVLISPEGESTPNEMEQKVITSYRNSQRDTQKAVEMLLRIHPSKDGKRPKIVVVDDLEDNVALLKRCLRKDYDVIEFTDPFEALKEILSSDQIDAVISDQRMPKMSGTEFFKKIEQNGKNPAKVIVSAYTDNQAFMEAINHTKVDAFILKPFEPEKLRERLSTILYGHSNPSSLQ